MASALMLTGTLATAARKKSIARGRGNPARRRVAGRAAASRVELRPVRRAAAKGRASVLEGLHKWQSAPK
jgi:hypothetical protein